MPPEDGQEIRLVAMTREMAEFAGRLDPDIGPLFGRDVARAYENGITEEEARDPLGHHLSYFGKVGVAFSNPSNPDPTR